MARSRPVQDAGPTGAGSRADAASSVSGPSVAADGSPTSRAGLSLREGPRDSIPGTNVMQRGLGRHGRPDARPGPVPVAFASAWCAPASTASRSPRWPRGSGSACSRYRRGRRGTGRCRRVGRRDDHGRAPWRARRAEGDPFTGGKAAGRVHGEAGHPTGRRDGPKPATGDSAAARVVPERVLFAPPAPLKGRRPTPIGRLIFKGLGKRFPMAHETER